METYSNSLSISSRMMTESGDRYASSKTLVISLLLACEEAERQENAEAKY
jgi:hypothetical protein